MTVGIALITRNSADILPGLLDPFVSLVDQVAILLGGRSTDNTPDVARRYGEVRAYDGPIDGEGRLMNFGLARQQSFDMLATDWALVVDTDDIWTGVEHLPEIVKQAGEKDVQRVRFLYHVGFNASFIQTRLYRRDSGHWESPVHNEWIPDKPSGVMDVSDGMFVRQEKGEGEKTQRLKQSIHISETYQAEHGDSPRLLCHLTKDYLLCREYKKVIETGARFLALVDLNRKNLDDTEKDFLFYTIYNVGVAHLLTGNIQLSYSSALSALMVRNLGVAWTLAAIAVFNMAQETKANALYEMVIFYADQALKSGKPRALFPLSYHNSTSRPLHVKAQALLALGREKEALAALDMALTIEPDNKDMATMQRQLCEALEVIL